jgi:hypothetical protein
MKKSLKPSLPSKQALQKILRELAAARKDGKTFCPSEAARAASPEWRELMPHIKEAALELVDAGELEVLQKGKRVDWTTAKGPVRLRRTE